MNDTGDHPRQLTVGVVIFDRMEVLDFAGPYEVFTVCKDALEEARSKKESPFRVFLVGEKDASKPVQTVQGMHVLADVTMDECPDLDILVVPGGNGSREQQSNPKMIDFIQRHASQKPSNIWKFDETSPTIRLPVTCSVCTGSLLLGEAGLLDGHVSTTHSSALERLQRLFPKTTVDPKINVAENKLTSEAINPQLYTSAGISAGINMSLRVVAALCGDTVARQTAAYMEYPFPQDNIRPGYSDQI